MKTVLLLVMQQLILAISVRATRDLFQRDPDWVFIIRMYFVYALTLSMSSHFHEEYTFILKNLHALFLLIDNNNSKYCN